MYIEYGLRGSRLTSAGAAGDDIDLVAEGASDGFLLTVGQGDTVLILVLFDEITMFEIWWGWVVIRRLMSSTMPVSWS